MWEIQVGCETTINMWHFLNTFMLWDGKLVTGHFTSLYMTEITCSYGMMPLKAHASFCRFLHYNPNSKWHVATLVFYLQGYELLVGVQKSAYSVWIGDEICEDIDITMNIITCLPPKSQPNDPLQPNTRVRVRSHNTPISLWLIKRFLLYSPPVVL